MTFTFLPLFSPPYGHYSWIALRYLETRGVRDQHLIRRLGMGYAPGGNLRRYLTIRGYRYDLLFELGLINRHGADAFCRRIV